MNPQPKPKRIRKKGHAYSKFKAELLERDGNTCTNPECRCKWDFTLPPINYILDVFHIIHRGRGGQDLLNNAVISCKYCHDLHHRGRLSNKFAVDRIKEVYGSLNS